MKIKKLLFSALIMLAAGSISAQEKELSLEEAVNLALKNGDRAKISEAEVETAKHELQVLKNARYPDVEVSGRYSYLSSANVDLQLQTGQQQEPAEEGQQTGSPEINHLLLGQANLTLPVFSGFKIKNSIAAGRNRYRAAEFNALDDKEQIALETIENYLNLFTARKTVDLMKESLKTAQQRVKDFTAMEQNGLLARNDLLKAQLQQSNVEVSLQQAQKTADILEYQLAVSLNLPEDTKIAISELGMLPQQQQLPKEINRADLEALKLQEKAAENGISAAKADYYPSVALIGGYTALDLQNALTVSNAMNVGVGVSYDLGGIFKNKSEVKVAQSRAEQLKSSIEAMNDQIKVQVKNAAQDYELALKKYGVYEKSVEQAVENYRIVKDKYDNGLSDTNDLLEADVQQLQSKLDLAYAKAGIMQQYYNLLRAEGALINQFKK